LTERLGPIQRSVIGHHRAKRQTRPGKSGGGPGGYVVIVRGPDGRPRFERFNDVAAYRARLSTLNTGNTENPEHSDNGSLSIEEIAGLLDTW
jgi:hypothetical protein